MAHNKQEANNQQKKALNSVSNSATSNNSTSLMAFKKGTPMIVERFTKIPMVNFAVTVGFTQYEALKSSNGTVNQVITSAEGWASYVWQKVQPIVEKFQEPINKADQLACTTLDFVEGKLNAVKTHTAQHFTRNLIKSTE